MSIIFVAVIVSTGSHVNVCFPQGLMYLKDLQSERGGKCKTETLDEDPSDTRVSVV